MRLLKFFLFICTIPVLTLGQAADSGGSSRPMTLDQLLEIALRNNPEIKAAVRKVTMAQAATAGSGTLEDPMFTYRDWGTPLSKPWDLNQAQNMFMVERTFPGAGKRSLQKTIAATGVDAAKTELETVRQDVLLRVRKAFLDLLRNGDEMQVHQRQDRLVRDSLQSALANYTVGKSPQQDVLKAQIALTKLNDHLLSLERERDLALAELNSALGFDPARNTEIQGTYRVPAELPDLSRLKQIALDRRPELAGLRAQLRKSELETHLAELGSKKPDFTVGGGYMLMPSGSMSRNTYMAELNVTLPWLNRGRHDAEIGEATAQTEAMRAELQARQNMVLLEIQQALVKARSARKSLALYRDILAPQSEATLKAAVAAYQTGRTDFLNLIDSQNMTLDVQTMTFSAAAEFDASLAELERAVGAPVPDIAAPVSGTEDKQ